MARGEDRHAVVKAAATGSIVLALAAGLATAAPSTSPELSAAPSNVCVTQYGVCPVVPGPTRGAPCQCFLLAQNTWVPGVAEYWVSRVPTEIP
jgi:hypothetical protein